MITRLKDKVNIHDWHKVYCYLPRTITIDFRRYRVYREWVWRKYTWDPYWSYRLDFKEVTNNSN